MALEAEYRAEHTRVIAQDRWLIGRATINFFQEEWEQFLAFIKGIDDVKPDEQELYRLEFDNVDIWMDEEDWIEFKNLTREISK